MIRQFIPNKSKDTLENLLFFFFSVYPIAFLLGNFAINLFLIIFNLLLILSFLLNKYDLNNINKYIVYLLLFLFVSFIVNLIFSKDITLTYPRVFKFLLIIGSIFSFRHLLCCFKKDDINKLYKIWSIIFLIVILDIIFELLFKSNIMGMSSFIPGRVASFTGNELNIGHFFSGFCLLFMSFIFTNYKKISFQFIIAMFLKICPQFNILY